MSHKKNKKMNKLTKPLKISKNKSKKYKLLSISSEQELVQHKLNQKKNNLKKWI